jgi:hypothetical protein
VRLVLLAAAFIGIAIAQTKRQLAHPSLSLHSADGV